MDIKEFYEIQKKYGFTCYKEHNLEAIMDLINNKGAIPPISTYKGFLYRGYQVMKGNKKIGYISYPIDKKNKNDKQKFKKRPIFSFNQVKKIEKSKE